MAQVDILTAFVAALVYVIIFYFWNSKYLFGKIRLKLQKINLKKKMKKGVFFIFLNFIIAWIIAYFLSLLEIFIGVTSFWDGMLLGFAIWIGFIATTQLFLVINEKRSFKLYLLDNCMYLLNFMIMGGIIAG